MQIKELKYYAKYTLYLKKVSEVWPFSVAKMKKQP